MVFDCDCNHYYEKNAQLRSTHTRAGERVRERMREKERKRNSKHCKPYNYCVKYAIESERKEKKRKEG